VHWHEPALAQYPAFVGVVELQGADLQRALA